jgi:pimeloyl-ACP methyl ester carboxylesterase
VAERRVRGDGLELAVRTWGDPTRPTVVLVHGYPDTHAVWIPLAEALVDHGFHVAAYDVRGAGASDRPEALEAYRFEHLVGDLAAVIDEVSPDRPVHLVGHDWGSIQSWAAVGDPNLDHRIASFTSISGPPLDHAGRWLRRQLRAGRVLLLGRQAVRSAYVTAFHVPGLQRVALRLGRGRGRRRRAWAATLRRVEGAQVDDAWPAPTFEEDVARGMSLYRANFRAHLRRPAPARPTPAPVLLILATKDRFVPEWLFEGIEDHAEHVVRRTVPARHWVVRSQPVDLAGWIADHATASAAAVEVGPDREEVHP